MILYYKSLHSPGDHGALNDYETAHSAGVPRYSPDKRLEEVYITVAKCDQFAKSELIFGFCHQLIKVLVYSNDKSFLSFKLKRI